MNRLPSKKRAPILRCLAEGMSIRSTARTIGISAPTISSLLAIAGNVCTTYMDKSMRDLPCQRLQCDEIWAFVYAKDRRRMNVSLMAPSIKGTSGRGSFGPDGFSHSGGTNAAGCHTNHKTGGYHCHNRMTLAPGTVHYCHVVGGEPRCGYARSTREVPVSP